MPTGRTSDANRVLWSTYTPEGPGTLELRQRQPDHLDAQAWGPGRDWLLAQAPAFVGQSDNVDTFEPPPQLRRRWKSSPFVLGRTGIVSDALVAAVFGQKVQTKKAKDSRRLLAKRHGSKAPGPYPGHILPSAEQLSNMTYSDFHKLGVERKRAASLLRGAQELVRYPNVGKETADAFKRRFENVRGIVPWSTNMAAVSIFGDADAVPLGDYHIPNTVSWNLAREPRATDDRMLELLAPYAGHRWRVIMLAKATGSAPKYGARLSLTSDGITRGR